MSHPPTVLGRLLIDRRFTGPPNSGNGGYVAGRLAGFLPDAPAVRVTLRQPPPLEAAMLLSADGDGVRATFGGVVVAEVVPAELDIDAVAPVPYDDARAAAAYFPGLLHHPYPTCFVCGTEKPSPDGLGLRPGRLPHQPDTTAAAWQPDASLGDGGSLPAAMVWAALDCPGGWTIDLVGSPAVLGQLTTAVDAVPALGEPCVVMGRLLGTQGRRSFTATTLYDADGRICARAAAVWVAVDPSVSSASGLSTAPAGP
jgi:hypothetical protein